MDSFYQRDVRVAKLIDELHLPAYLRGKANPKSSTGRLDVFTRVITDHSSRFDDIRAGYDGKLYLEVVPLSFTVKVKQGLALNQLRLSIGPTRLSDDEIHDLHRAEPLLYRNDRPVPDSDLHQLTVAGITADELAALIEQARAVYRARAL